MQRLVAGPIAALPPHAGQILPPLRRWLARQLRRTSVWLRQWARSLAAEPAHPGSPPVPDTLPRLEYHADAGAPEGALYVDGEYVGRLAVRRL